jgi:L,D-peptidoglycan transpeptidase YkuD (ErfK/YbiS/YcfS/YnhG family)
MAKTESCKIEKMRPEASASISQKVSPMLASSQQLLLVVAPVWEGCIGQLQRYQRMSSAGEWQAFGRVIPVSLGKSGLAWGRGLHPSISEAGREKREGDGRAPAGIFSITALFGYAAPESPLALGAKLPYLCATKDLKAIDDPASAYYNRIVDQSTVAEPDWASCEDMLRHDQRYVVGAVVAHNAQPSVVGGGSCIFLHVWESEATPTAGCTAMTLADMSQLTGWLDAAARPVLVQLPQAEYERWREIWALPAFPVGDSLRRQG